MIAQQCPRNGEDAAVAAYNFTEHRPTYNLPFARKELYQRIESLGFRVSGSTGLWPDFNKHRAYIVPSSVPQWKKPRTGSAELFEAVFDVDNSPGGVIVRVTKIEVKHGTEPLESATAVRMFENRVIAPSAHNFDRISLRQDERSIFLSRARPRLAL